MLGTLLMIAAVVCFGLAALSRVLKTTDPLTLIAAGLFFWALTSLL